MSLIETITASASIEPGSLVCIGRAPREVHDAILRDDPLWPELRYIQAPTINDGVDALAAVFESVDVAGARSVVVLPQRDADEPDANSRVTCVALARACGGGKIPNTLVEVEDPEAAFEFAGLGVATVFYPGYLRAALLAQACVDLGVFQFVYGLLDGRYRVRLIEVPPELSRAKFVEAARNLDEDAEGRPLTIIGLQRAAAGELVINPGPRASLDGVIGLLALEAG